MNNINFITLFAYIIFHYNIYLFRASLHGSSDQRGCPHLRDGHGAGEGVPGDQGGDPGGDPGGDLAGEGDEGAEVPQGGGGAAPGQDRESAAAHAARHSRGPFKVSLYAELLHKIKIN